MRTVIYRRSLSFTSGAGQLIATQVRALRAAGIDAELFCQRGAMRFWLRSGLRARRWHDKFEHRFAAAADCVLVDHGMELPQAQIVFCHNLMTEARKFLIRPEIEAAAEQERAFFARLNPQALVVANSKLVRDAIIEHFDWPAAQLSVCYPGYRADVFVADQRGALRTAARRSLGISDDTPLVGFVTSGDLHKRGLGVFLDAAMQMLEQRPELRFLIVGSRALPDWTRQHALTKRGRLFHRAKGTSPQQWMAALDVFLYPARYEEFGMVVLEASALGVPVVTSRRVGSVECLPDENSPWISDSPEPDQLGSLALSLLADDQARSRLSGAAIESAREYTDARYARESVSIITSYSKPAAQID